MINIQWGEEEVGWELDLLIPDSLLGEKNVMLCREGAATVPDVVVVSQCQILSSIKNCDLLLNASLS